MHIKATDVKRVSCACVLFPVLCRALQRVYACSKLYSLLHGTSKPAG
ncbi:hypothetical protein HMPREF0091_10291 [Fannyhessea vaginae DSM 15829]|uniref:Uncharacterized protein n=1 Tax=Fannyhessea vaginae DSM 15829 TaxID=525256 RepID=F1T3Q0_9ACTN|nr:hypothetical protein HMPREF0091_10291 [Fannyhessea vaginae DSM 15829]